MWPLLRCSQLNAADLRKNGRRCSPLRNQILVGSMKLVCPTSAEILLSTRTVSLEIMVIMTLAGTNGPRNVADSSIAPRKMTKYPSGPSGRQIESGHQTSTVFLKHPGQ